MANFHLPSTRTSLHSRGGDRLRAVLSLVAAIAGGLGVLALALVLIGSVSPGQAAGLWIAMAILIGIWATGIWWRTDSPDRRSPQQERERRGF